MTDPTEPPHLSPGQEWAGYRILRPIAHGELGTAYLATSITGPGQWILRCFGQAITAEERRAAEEERLAHGLALAASPHLPAIGTVEVRDGRLLIAVERVDGLPLALTQPAAPEDLFATVTQVLRGLQVVQGVGRCHGRLTPARIVRRRDGTVVLVEPPSLVPVMTDQVPVEPPSRWTAPEVRGGRPPDLRADLYAVGMLLRDLCLGADDDAADDRPVAERRPDLHPQIDEILEGLTAEDPADRWPSPELALQALQRCPRQPPPSQGAVLLARVRQAWPWLQASLGWILLLVLLVVAAMWFRELLAVAKSLAREIVTYLGF